MSRPKLNIIPVKLEPLEEIQDVPTNDFHEPICIIKVQEKEIQFYKGIDESIVQTIVKELRLFEA
ncbi:hypothetical protein NYE67_03125 [Solibacillus sp. FSL W8-0474]|uniref:hypothetical protein n=1 Tax=Solibacillus sp. FSL W8-0474 TaxID=2975336 RepID=UPI0030F67E96